MKSTHKNPYFNPQAKYTPPNLEKYIAATKTAVSELVKKPTTFSSNLSQNERDTLDSLRKRTDISITSADKGGKVVVMDRKMYIDQCKNQLEDREFYKSNAEDSTQLIIEEIRSDVNDKFGK